MPFREIDDMDIIADAGAVGCVVIIAEYMDHFQLAGSDLGDIGQQVVGDALGILADETAHMGADGIEIAQQHHSPLIIRAPDIGQDALLHGFCLTVGIGRNALGALLGDRYKGRIAVHSRRRGKDQLLAAVISHDIAESQCGIQIVAIVFDRHAGGFTDSLIARKMDHGINLLFFKNLFETLAVTNVLLIKFRAFTCDLLDAVNHHLLGIIEIVSDHHIVSCIQKLHNRVASDKSCSACH